MRKIKLSAEIDQCFGLSYLEFSTKIEDIIESLSEAQAEFFIKALSEREKNEKDKTTLHKWYYI